MGRISADLPLGVGVGCGRRERRCCRSPEPEPPEKVGPCCGAPVSPASVRRQGSESCLLWDREGYPCASGSQRLATGSSSGGGEPTRRPSECARRLAVVELDRVVTGMKMRLDDGAVSQPGEDWQDGRRQKSDSTAWTIWKMVEGVRSLEKTLAESWACEFGV